MIPCCIICCRLNIEQTSVVFVKIGALIDNSTKVYIRRDYDMDTTVMAAFYNCVNIEKAVA